MLQTTLESINDHPHVVLVGNPNVGKSVIFNHLTGSNQKVANFPGITLQYLDGKMDFENTQYKITDLPGIYGFISNKLEETIAHQYLVNNKPDLIINVADSTRIERNLYLTLQLLEMNIPTILVLTFKDKMDKKKINYDVTALEEKLGIPVIAINAISGQEVKNLKEVINETLKSPSDNTSIVDLKEFEPIISQIEQKLEQPLILEGNDFFSYFPKRWIVLSSILAAQGNSSLWPTWIQTQVREEIDKLKDSNDQFDSAFHLKIINYYHNKAKKFSEIFIDGTTPIAQPVLTRLDNLLLHPIYGILVFIVLMFTIFQTTFYLSEPLSIMLETWVLQFGELIRDVIPSEFIASFLADGLIGGVGFVMVFIPQIALLFIFIGLMEQSGYLSRVVFLLDRYLTKLDITGTSVAPMLLGFGCNVPGVMATKSIQDENERIAVALVNPFMSCSARLPVYVVIAGAIFPDSVGIVLTFLYLLGIILAITILYVLRNTILPGETEYLFMELHDLSVPRISMILKFTYRHLKKFVKNAASWMALGLVFIWFLSVFGPSGYLGPEALSSSELMKESWIYTIGNILTPIFTPLHWDNRLIVALVLGFVAKEIVVGSLGVLYGVGTTQGGIQPILTSVFTPATALSFLVFVLIYTPCIGTYFTMKEQVGSKWANFSVGMSLIIAYAVALLVGNIATVLI